jgi:hypothetical protein
VCDFRQEITLEDDIEVHTSLLRLKRPAVRVHNGIPLGCSLLSPVGTVNCVHILKGSAGLQDLLVQTEGVCHGD